ncbi:tail length tape measure protein [Gordonia phage Sukkupi]|uniref:Tape measure protein n=1 Tax=Gordonia phage Sukkupi TaxID=2653747 RepID=A0A5Q2WLE1_9CAUD|nr:tail length tape measure protein [Gordonia phage Sukkupi]QAU07090.1 tape measure protein [Gordonia phage BiPauneto]QGH79284.1 tape measure protein [Gordonia phage Sukkupi]QGH80757.1 tape measure protein [Gordonia phage Yndexa]
MAKTFLVGEGAVRLIPNAAGFHLKARAELKKEPLNVKVDLKPNMSGFTTQAKGMLKSVTTLKVGVELRPDATGFSQKAQAKLDATKKLRVKADIIGKLDAGSIARAHAAAQMQLTAMGPLKISIHSDIDDASLRRALEILKARVEATRITANINSRNGRDRGMPGGGSGGGRGGNGPLGRRPVRNAAIGSAVVMAPIVTKAAVGGLTALIGAASQAAGALGLLPAAATAAGAGLAAIAIGAAGIGGAFSALSKESKSAGADVASSASQQAAAQRALAGADRGLQTAHRGVTRALEDLNDARKEAVRRLRDMNDEMKMAPLNEREAALAIKEAQRSLQEAYASGDSLEIEGAQINLEKSKLQYDQLRKQNDDLATDVAEANRKGVEGDKEVISAKDGVTDAYNSLADAQDAMAAALDGLAQASKSAAAGVDQLQQAMDKLSPKAQQFVRQVHALGPAWTETRKFIQDALFDHMGDSVTKLANVQLPVLKTGLAGIATEINSGVRGALAAFSTDMAAADFTTTLENSRQMWAGIGQSFAPFSVAFMNLATVGSSFMPRLGTAISNMASSFKEFTDRTRADGSMEEFFNNSIEMAKQLGRILSNVGHILGSIFSAGAETGAGFLNTIETATAELREFLASAEGQEGLKTFFEGVKVAVQTLAPIIQIVASTLLTALGPALTDLVIGLGPGLVAMFEGLSSGLHAIQPVMQVVGGAIGSIGFELGKVFEVLGPVIAQTLTALAPAVAPLAELLGHIITGLAPILPLVAQFVGLLISALAPALTKIVDALTPVIQQLVDALMPILPPIMDVLGQVASAIADALVLAIESLLPFLPQLVELWGGLIQSLLPLVPILVNLALSVVPPLVRALEGILPVVMRVIQILADMIAFVVPILIPVLKLLSAVVTEVFSWIGSLIGAIFRNVLDPIFSALGRVIGWLGDLFHWLWEEAIKPAWDGIAAASKWAWENVIQPAFEGIKTGISKVGDFFSAVVDGIGKAWGKLGEIASKPINWVINHVVNGGIGKAWSAVDNFLGGHLPDWKDVPQIAMATGGEVPLTKDAERGKDSVRVLAMPGEHMWDVTNVERAGGQKAMYRMRDMVDRGQPFTWTPAGIAAAKGDGALPRYAKGGEISAGDRLAPLPGEGGLQPIAQLMARIIKATWPNTVTSIGGYRPPDGYNEHSSGRALDVMVSELGGKTGDEVTEFSMANHKNYPVNWTIWKQMMHYPPDGRTSQMEDRGSPTQNHMDHPHIFYSENQKGPINPNVMPDNIAFGGVTDAAVRKGITAWAEKAFNTALAPVKKLVNSDAFAPPPQIKATPKHMYDGIVEPAKEKLLDKVSELTSMKGWKNMLGGAVDKVKSAGGNLVGGAVSLGKKILFDTGGVVRPGTTVVQNNTGKDEYMLDPFETMLLRGLVEGLRGLGIKPTLPSDTGPQTSTPETQDVNIAGVGGKSTSPGELPVPESKDIEAPTPEELGEGEVPDGGTIELVQNADGTWSAKDPEWNKLIQRESGGRADVVQGVSDANSGGNEASGLFQIAKGTWASYGGTKFAPTAGEATPEQQAEIAAKIFNAEGGSPWGSGAGQNLGREDEAALRAGIKRGPSGAKGDPVNVTSKDWPTTADDVKPGDTTGSAYGQNLQGAAIGQDGSYKPDNNVTAADKGGNAAADKPMFSNPFETTAGKFAMKFAENTPLGIGGPQAKKLQEKAPAVTELANGIAKAAPAWGAALAGDPTQLIANVGQATGQWATKTASDFAQYLPEAAPGMLESALSAIGGPLIGTVNTGVSEEQLMSTMEDAQNRQIRRSKTGRRRY